jgi:hypothetical protein
VFVVPDGFLASAELWRSLDRGETWENVAPTGPAAQWFYWLDEDAAGNLYACSPYAFFVTSNGGAGWEIRPAPPSACETRKRFAVTPAGLLFSASDSGLFRSADGALTWEPVVGPEGYFGVVSATSDGSVYAAGAVGVGQARRHFIYASHDGGVTWSSGEIFLEQPYHSVLDLEEGPGGLVFAATTDPRSIHQSTDGGVTWALADGDLPENPDTNYGDLAYDRGGRLLVALGTSGLYRTTTPVGASPSPVIRESSLSHARPNPAVGLVRFALSLPSPIRLRATVHDALGREVAVVHDGPIAQGVHTLTVDTASFRPGVYAVRVLGDGLALSQLVTVAR